MIYFSPFSKAERKGVWYRRSDLKFLLTMKLILLLSIVFSLGAYASGNAQNISIDMKNAALEEVLEEVSAKSNLRLFYDQNAIKNMRIAELRLSNASVSSILKEAIRGKNLTFQIVDQTIVLRERLQTDLEVSGVVRDQNGPIEGVTVIVDKTPSLSTRTDAGGYYTLRVPKDAKITFRYLGYADQSFEITTQRALNVLLEVESSMVDEVVVVGYGTQKKENLTGAVDQIDSKRIEAFKATNLGEALAGQVPNLNIGVSDGKPGREASFNVRG